MYLYVSYIKEPCTNEYRCAFTYSWEAKVYLCFWIKCWYRRKNWVFIDKLADKCHFISGSTKYSSWFMQSQNTALEHPFSWKQGTWYLREFPQSESSLNSNLNSLLIKFVQTGGEANDLKRKIKKANSSNREKLLKETIAFKNK